MQCNFVQRHPRSCPATRCVILQESVLLKISLPLDGPTCSAAAATLYEFMTSTLGFAFDTTGASCHGGGNGAGGRRMSRRLAQSSNGAAEYNMVANLSGPYADVSLGTAISPTFPDNVLSEFGKAFPSSSISSNVGKPFISSY
jgi:hypothetical protein